MTTINLTSFIIVNDSGNIDIIATMDKFQILLYKYQTECEIEHNVISQAVHAVFDQYKGTTIRMAAIAGISVQKLNGQPENFKILTNKVKEFVKKNSGDKGSGKLFRILKGKNSGVIRCSDYV